MNDSKDARLEELTNEDKKILKSYLIQMFYTYLFIAIAAIIFVVVIVYMVDSAENDFISENRLGLKMTIIFLSLIVFILAVWIQFEQPVQDIRSGKKEVVIAAVTDKKTNTRWGWHENAAADFVSQPRLVEYLLTIDGKVYFVEKDFYYAVNINDKVELNFTYPNHDFFLAKQVV